MHKTLCSAHDVNKNRISAVERGLACGVPLGRSGCKCAASVTEHLRIVAAPDILISFICNSVSESRSLDKIVYSTLVGWKHQLQPFEICACLQGKYSKSYEISPADWE